MKNKLIKKISGIFGFKLVEKKTFKNARLISKYTSLTIKRILSILFDQNEINSIIQIGANDGKSFDELNYFIIKNQTQSLLVEPIKNNFEILKKTYTNFNFINLENSAISVNNEISHLFKVNPKYQGLYGSHIPAIPSFKKNHLIAHGVKNKHILKENIVSISIKDLINKYKIDNFDLFYIDAEGYDGKIVHDFLLTVDIRPIIVFEYIHIDNGFFEILLKKLNDKDYLFFSIAENLVCFPKEREIKLNFL